MIIGTQNIFDGLVLPFIVFGPDLMAGRRTNARLNQHSLFPAICYLPNLPKLASVEFPSLLPLLNGSCGRLCDSVYHSSLNGRTPLLPL